MGAFLSLQIAHGPSMAHPWPTRLRLLTVGLLVHQQDQLPGMQPRARSPSPTQMADLCASSNSSVGIGCCSRQTMLMGLVPS